MTTQFFIFFFSFAGFVTENLPQQAAAEFSFFPVFSKEYTSAPLTGQAAIHSRQRLHLVSETLSAAEGFTPERHTLSQALQSVHRSMFLLIEKGANLPANPCTAPNGQRNLHHGR